MIERNEDLWKDFTTPGHRIAISTNGFVKRNGEAVMGRGCAKQATELFPGIAQALGVRLRIKGNSPGYLFIPESKLPSDRLMILPVKHNWWEKADLGLVGLSVAFLAEEAHDFRDWVFHVPRLGCGNGKLSWSVVVQSMMAGLPDNVVVHS